MQCDELFEKKEERVSTRRESLVADIASIEGDIGRTRLAFADGGDLLIAATELEREGEYLIEVASRMGQISREALREVLDRQR